MLSKRRKRNKSNLFGGGLLLLSSLSLVSIGFSTWTITDSASADLDITADGVVIEEIISIGIATYDFSIGEEGMVGKENMVDEGGTVYDHTVVTSGHMKMAFSITNSKAISFLSGDNKYKATITLSENSSPSFLTYVDKMPSGKQTSSSENVEVDKNSSASDSSIINTISFSCSSSDKTGVAITYTITDKIENSKSAISSNFYENQSSLSFSVSLEDPT